MLFSIRRLTFLFLFFALIPVLHCDCVSPCYQSKINELSNALHNTQVFPRPFVFTGLDSNIVHVHYVVCIIVSSYFRVFFKTFFFVFIARFIEYLYRVLIIRAYETHNKRLLTHLLLANWTVEIYKEKKAQTISKLISIIKINN